MAKRSTSGGSSGRRGSSRNSSGSSFSGGRKSGGAKSFRKSDSKSSDRNYRKDDGDAPKRSSRSYGSRDGGSADKRSSFGDRKSSYKRDDESSSRGSSYRGKESTTPRKTSYRKSDNEGGERSGDRFKKSDKPYSKREGGSSSERSFGNKRGGGFRKEGDSESRGRSSYGDKRESSSSRPRKTSFRKSDSDEGSRSGSRFNKFDKPFEKRDGSARPRKTGFRKSEGDNDNTRESKNFDKPFEKRTEGSFDSRKPRRSSGSSFRDKRDENANEESGVRRGRFDKYSGDERSERPSRGKSKFGADEPRGFFKKSKTRYEPKSDRKQSHDTEAPTQTEKMRLNRFIANSGVCSRREADNLIGMGLISVNGKTVTEMGYKVNPGDEVRYENKVLKAEKPVYILMNKPKGFLTTTDDPQERNTVMHIIGSNVKERIYPVGRLDRNTTGLLLLTNDGDLADKLMHPSYNVKKIYKVELDRPITKADLQAVMDGVILEEGRALVDDVAIVSEDGKTVGVEIHIGWNRVVRRIFESFGYEVVKLDRSVYAGLDKKELGRGQWRFLTKEEITRLKHFK
jgi:23S rRNA pseudouridine2605 synthase